MVFVGDRPGLDVAHIQPPGNPFVEDEQDVEVCAVRICHRDGVFGGALGLVATVCWRQHEVDLAHRVTVTPGLAKTRRNRAPMYTDRVWTPMFETVVVATDGSASAARAVDVALDFSHRFDATVHAVYVVDRGDVAASPDDVRDDFETALESLGEEALEYVAERGSVQTAVREGDPVGEIIAHGHEHDADLIATGTRGRHGEHSFLLGSVAEGVVRRSPMPVLTVRQLDPAERPR